VGDGAGLLDRIWRTDAAGMLGALSRRLGDFDRAEARTAAERALELAANPAERELMSRRVGEPRRRR
jgi:RNA polymerase sigma-70 factor (ECF subfamily)